MSPDPDSPPFVLRPQPSPREDPREVDVEQYCKLLVERRRFDRLTMPPPGFRGLRDPHSGETYLVREATLLDAS